jgi:signal transduction histidine kinase
MSVQDSREVQALRSLHELMTSVNSADQVGELLQAVVQGVVEIIGFRIAVIYVLDDHDILEVVAVAGEDESAREAMMGRRVALSELAEEFEIADHWGGLRFVPHERLPEDATSSWIPDFEPLDVPDAWHPLDALYALLHDPAGRLLGILGVDLPHDMRRPGLLGRQVLEMYAVQAGLAIHHAQARARLAEQVALGEATRVVVAAPASWLDAGSILEHSLAPLSEGYRCDRLWVTTFEEGRDARRVPDAMHPAGLAEWVDEGDRECLRQLAARCWAQRRAVVVAELGDTSAGILGPEEREHLCALVSRLGGGHLLATPLGSGSEVLGCVVMLRDADAPTWSPLEGEAAVTLGQEIGRSVMHERLYTTERRLNAELHELDRYKNELMGTITHELKAPLTVIDGHVELLEESSTPAPSILAIRRGTERLQRLVEDLLLLARVKDPHVPLERTPVDLAEVISEVEDLFSLEVRRRDLTLSSPGVRRGVVAWGDRDELARAVVNVVGNAVKYTPDGGRVTLRLQRDTGAAVFSCTDTGIGIDPEDQAGLFEEFNRSSNPEAHAVPGTGLGLAIVKRIVERHDGTITVASRPGRGSTFRIAVPAPPVASS